MDWPAAGKGKVDDCSGWDAGVSQPNVRRTHRRNVTSWI
jgi:hypothetical protein